MNNPHWGRLLEVVQQQRMPSAQQRRQHMSIDGSWLDLPSIPNRVWAVLSAHMNDPLYMSRVQLVAGKDGHGPERLRTVHEQCEGGAEQCHLAGLNRFMTFGPCPSRSKLASYLGEWEQRRRQYGHQHPGKFLYTMLLNLLPTDVAAESRDRRQRLNTTDLVIEYLHCELARYNVTSLSKLHGRQDYAARASSASNPVNAVMEDAISNMNNKLDSMCAAFQKGQRDRARSPSGGAGRGGAAKGGGEGGSTLPKTEPSFMGGWHCGKKHPGGRRRCPESRKLIQEHGGLPKDYRGAYERFIDSQGKLQGPPSLQDQAVVDAVAGEVTNTSETQQAADASGDENPETLNRFVAFIEDHKAEPAKPVETHNAFNCIANDSSDNDGD